MEWAAFLSEKKKKAERAQLDSFLWVFVARPQYTHFSKHFIPHRSRHCSLFPFVSNLRFSCLCATFLARRGTFGTNLFFFFFEHVSSSSQL